MRRLTPMPQIKRILCPLDFSELSRHALDQALALAGWYGARITALHVLVPPPMPIDPGIVVEDALVTPPQPHEAADELRRFCGIAAAHATSPLEMLVVEGNPVKAIVSEAVHLKADLIVMSTHGQSGFERLFLGSVTERVLRTTTTPVLTVPPPVEHVDTVVYRSILCPIEFSDASTRALEYALTLAEETNAHLTLLHVLEGLATSLPSGEGANVTVAEYMQLLESSARARLASAIPDSVRDWCTPEERVVTGKASDRILQAADETNADLIVMGVHGVGLLNRRLLGSTTHHVLREARCPVLTLRG
jgi:nucleotide-binding universal stress UspA family protein